MMIDPQRTFDAASEWAERVLATWRGAGAYAVLAGICGAVWGWNGVDRFIYVTTAVVVVLLIGSGRRDNKAAQAKLDTLTEGHELDRLEEKPEREIEAARGEVK